MRLTGSFGNDIFVLSSFDTETTDISDPGGIDIVLVDRLFTSSGSLRDTGSALVIDLGDEGDAAYPGGPVRFAHDGTGPALEFIEFRSAVDPAPLQPPSASILTLPVLARLETLPAVAGIVPGTDDADRIEGPKGQTPFTERGFVFGNGGGDTISVASGLFRLVSGGDGPDSLTLSGRASAALEGGAGDDTLRAGGGDDRLQGGLGDDLMRGRGGDDWLAGDRGLFEGLTVSDDRLFGGAGDDTLDAGGGRDRLTGGPGADAFVLGFDYGRDRVTDFDPETDYLLILPGPFPIGTPFELRTLDDRTIVRDPESDSRLVLLGVSLTEDDIVWEG